MMPTRALSPQVTEPCSGGRAPCRGSRRFARRLAALLAAAVLGVVIPASSAPAAVMAWGRNQLGSLGSESIADSSVPILVYGLDEVGFDQVTEVAASSNFNLALLSDGQVLSWGADFHGTLGDGRERVPSHVPVLVSGLNTVTEISSSHGYSLALLRDGQVMAWGHNQTGRFGDGEAGGDSDVPVPVEGLTGVVAISASQFHSLALLNDGTVMGWGDNTRGELGNGTRISTDVPVPAAVGLTEVAAVSAGDVTSLVLLRNGTVMSFGAGEYGQLGNGHGGEYTLVPVKVDGLNEVTAISAGAWQNLALLRDGTAMAWGWNKSGELGDGTNMGPQRCGHYGCSRVPIPVSGLSDVTAISAASNTGNFNTNVNGLALLGNGTLMAWGGDEYGQLGDGSTTSSYVPVPVSGIAEVTAISAGGYQSLALTRSTIE